MLVVQVMVMLASAALKEIVALAAWRHPKPSLLTASLTR